MHLPTSASATCQALIGVDFSTQGRVFNTHTLLAWSAFCIAIFTVFLAFMHFNITHNRTTLVIGTARFGAGTMDTLYTPMAGWLLEEEDSICAYDLGANSYIIKPVELQPCVQVIQALEAYWFRKVVLPPHQG